MKVGIDLGGTKIEIVVLDDASRTLFRERVITPKNSYQDIVNAIVLLVQKVQDLYPNITKVGVGIPGAVSHVTGKIKNANTTCLIGESLQSDLELKLALTVRLANDANCFTLSEALDGAAKNQTVVFGVIIGTGCGGGIVVNGQVIQGKNSIAGEWGHNPLPYMTYADAPDGQVPCYCGQVGCIETFLSGPGFQEQYRLGTGQQLTVPELLEQAQAQNNSEAQVYLDRYAQWLAKALASVINVLDPDVIVLGGGLSNMDYLYQRVPQLWQQWVFSDQVDTQLVQAKWGDSSGVRGAAWLE